MVKEQFGRFLFLCDGGWAWDDGNPLIDESLEIVGCKAAGLSKVPSLWCPQFVVIPAFILSPICWTERVHEIHGAEKTQQTDALTDLCSDCLDFLQGNAASLIARSSSYDETPEMRGAL